MPLPYKKTFTALCLSATLLLSACGHEDTDLITDVTYPFEIQDTLAKGFGKDLTDHLAHAETRYQSLGIVDAETNKEVKDTVHYYFFFADKDDTEEEIKNLKQSIEHEVKHLITDESASNVVAYLLKNEDVYHTMRYYTERNEKFPIDDYLYAVYMNVDDYISKEEYQPNYELTEITKAPAIKHEVDTTYEDEELAQYVVSMLVTEEEPLTDEQIQALVSYYTPWAKKESGLPFVYIQIRQDMNTYNYDELMGNRLQSLILAPIEDESIVKTEETEEIKDTETTEETSPTTDESEDN